MPRDSFIGLHQRAMITSVPPQTEFLLVVIQREVVWDLPVRPFTLAEPLEVFCEIHPGAGRNMCRGRPAQKPGEKPPAALARCRTCRSEQRRVLYTRLKPRIEEAYREVAGKDAYSIGPFSAPSWNY